MHELEDISLKIKHAGFPLVQTELQLHIMEGEAEWGVGRGVSFPAGFWQLMEAAGGCLFAAVLSFWCHFPQNKLKDLSIPG